MNDVRSALASVFTHRDVNSSVRIARDVNSSVRIARDDLFDCGAHHITTMKGQLEV